MYTTTQRVYRGVGGGNDGRGSLNGQFKLEVGKDSSFANEFIPPNPPQMTLVD